MNHFVSKPIKKEFSIRDHTITLQLEPEVFSPSDQGITFAEHVTAYAGEQVMDMGTGTGLLGIIAAKQGGVVTVTDTSEKALLLAQKNASLNDVSLQTYLGKYFCTPKQNYDYIISNLPQERLPTLYKKSIRSLRKTIDGGQKGNAHILQILNQARNHMHKDSRMLLGAYSMSDYISTLQKMRLYYHAKLLDVTTSPAKDFVQENIEYYLKDIQYGDVGLFKKNNKWQSTLFIYELRKK